MVRVLPLLLAAALLACDGCEGRRGTSSAVEAPMAEAAEPPPIYEEVTLTLPDGGGVELLGNQMLGESLILEQRLLPLAGPKDFENRYLFTVRVEAQLNEREVEICSGTVLSRRLVLTTGHCVCPRKQETSPSGERRTVIDTSSCAKTATVETLLYGPSFREGNGTAWGDAYTGTVRPHPEFKILLDDQGHVLSTHADLAVILLHDPLDKKYGEVALADTEVRVGESIIIAGYGYDELSNSFGLDRRSCSNKVTRFLEPGGERILVEQPGQHLYRLDSGGPCLRVGSRTTTLVGISSRELGTGATFISTYGYRDWLRAELQHAEKARPRPRLITP